MLWAGIAGFAALAALAGRKRAEAIDLAITGRLQAIRDPGGERAMAAVSWLGFPPQSRVLPPTYAAVLWIARFRLEAVFQLAAWGTALLSTIIKPFMRRPRPVAGQGPSRRRRAARRFELPERTRADVHGRLRLDGHHGRAS